MTTPPGGGPLDPAAQFAAIADQQAALASQLDRLQRAVERADQRAAEQAELRQAAEDAVAARIEQAERDNIGLRAELDQAAATLAELAEQAKAQRARPGGPPQLSWLDPQVTPEGANRPPSQTVLRDLGAWLERVYCRLPGPRLPACWAFHPGVVDILLALRMAHAEVYTARTGTWERALTWHIRLRPDAADKIGKWIGGCEIRLHQAGGPLYPGADPEVPLAAWLDEIAAVWAARRETPDPMPSLVDAADAYMRGDLTV